MNADQMLEELGFKFDESKVRSDIRINRYLRYKKELGGSYYGKVISFDLKDKQVRVSKETLYNTQQACYSTLEEQKAIFKKIEELGW